MANNINGIYGYGYGINYPGYGKQNKDVTNENASGTQEKETPAQTMNVDPNEVLNFLASSSVVINNAPAVPQQNDADTNERIEGSVQNFEMIYSVIAQEFGDDIANLLLNDDEFLDSIMAQA